MKLTRRTAAVALLAQAEGLAQANTMLQHYVDQREPAYKLGPASKRDAAAAIRRNKRSIAALGMGADALFGKTR